MFTVGCDQHKKYSFVVSKDMNGQIVDQLKFYHTDKTLMKNYFSSLPAGSTVALEACGFDHWLGDLLEECGTSFKLAHTAKTKAIASERIKTDKISASVLADLLRANLLPEAYRPPRPIRDDRARLRYRLHLIYIRSSLKNRIHSIIDFHGIQHSFSDLYGQSGREFLAQLDISEPYRSMINNYLDLIDNLSDRIAPIDSFIRQHLKNNDNASLLMSIPGIGPITAFTVLSEIADINRFNNHKQFARFIGIVPTLHQSGQMLHQGRITKQGNKYLRTAFVEAAHTAIRKNPYLMAFFNKIKSKKGYNVAIVAVAHKLATIAFAVLKKKTVFRFQFHNG